MFCKKCGAQLPEDAKFCKKCGMPIEGFKTEDTTGMPKSDGSPNDADLNKHYSIMTSSKDSKKKTTRKEKKAKKKAERTSWSIWKKIRRFLLKLMWIIFLILVLIFGGASTITYFDIVDIPVIEKMLNSMGLKESKNTSSTENEEEPFRVESPDADDYYGHNSQIISQIDVNDSDVVLTEAELRDNLAVRGFEDYPVTTEYSMGGEFFDAMTISETSSEKHPIYQTNYVTANGEVWTIFIINGSVMANPVSYNMQSGLGVQVIISELETVTSYDSTTNKFYETIPDESALIVKVVEEINVETLENLTFGAIDEL